MKCTQINTISLSDLDEALRSNFPEAHNAYTNRFDLKNSLKLFSPFQIQLPKTISTQIQTFNSLFFKRFKIQFEKSKTDSFQLRNQIQLNSDFKMHPQVLSCLDFHIDLENDKIKLIEANTNASGYLMGSLVYQLHGLDFSKCSKDLFEMFKKSNLLDSDKLFITDENPESQKMFLEFLMYKDFFKQKNYDFEIMDITELEKKLLSSSTNHSVSIYNRSTDFYLKNHKTILDLFLKQKIQLNPNPVDYDLWAHKDNLSQISNLSDQILSDHEQMIFNKFILKSAKIQDLFPDLDAAWNERKRYFFKPSESYGGKASYKGSSVSKTYFENLWTQNFLAQEFFAPPKFKDENQNEWKYDLRVYTFEDNTLLTMARVYQGQITNFSTIGGGFAHVEFY